MKKIKYILAVLLTTTIITSCEKQVTDLLPIDQIRAEVAIQNMNDVTLAVNGVYGTWQGRRPSHVSSFITDEIRLGTGSEYRNVGNALFNWLYVSDTQDWRDDDNGGAWTNLYAVIDRANRILELMVPVPTPTANDVALKAQFRGEMLAVRALAHLELLRWYSATPDYQPNALGVVLQTQFAKAPGSYFPSRATQLAVVTSITADLNEARNLIPTTFTDISRVTRNAVIGGQAKLALHTRNWNDVVTRSTELLALQPITNIAGYPSIWTTRSLPAAQNTEVIWKLNVQQVNLGAAVGSLWQDVGTGAVQASAAVKLTNTFNQTSDVRFSTFFRNVSGRNLIAKYGVVAAGNGENFQYDTKMMRSSEFLLARAEAYAELNQIASANADLSALRSNRITGYAHTAINDRTQLINEILTERYKELCYEGHRYFDLKRRVLPINRDLADAGGIASITNMAVTSFTYLLPIPQQEILANPRCQQNPGY